MVITPRTALPIDTSKALQLIIAIHNNATEVALCKNGVSKSGPLSAGLAGDRASSYGMVGME